MEIERRTLSGHAPALLGNKRGANALAFALLVRFFAAHARFPRGRIELPDQVVEFVARQVGVQAAELSSYVWSGRTYERHRVEIRAFLRLPGKLGGRSGGGDGLAVGRGDPGRAPRGACPGGVVGLAAYPPVGGSDIGVERMVRSALQRGDTALMERLCALLSANAQIFYGKAGDIASNRRDEQEMSVLCLHIVQAAMVHINTLMIQNVLRDPEWSAALSKTDYRALTPLFWAHAAMHGEFKLNMRTRMTIDSATSAI